MKGVAALWASIGWTPTSGKNLGIRPFTNGKDPFLHGLAAEFFRQYSADALEPVYCKDMAHAMGRYIGKRYGTAAETSSIPLSAWQLRRITEYVEAHMTDGIRVQDLADVAAVSTGHLHRAFRAATGLTPSAFISERRIRRAIAILKNEPKTIAQATLRVGIRSPSRLAGQMRRLTGYNPSGSYRGRDRQ
ncbi:AraC family transcriptional regulator [Methylobacterium sp. Leaf100]|uniref:helix-turn-helix domain-containing protein n=1 Tax=Methylobacterium sp. Leaf100 TaxID=1736252 RepID=UPI0006F5FF0B|nr:AraC family transcriptional regulator [Methylobacterium sp. Leaf100]KQP26635.1 hypothetical protein ASF25_07790 [Methylobacterium sp. Leaf100]